MNLLHSSAVMLGLLVGEELSGVLPFSECARLYEVVQRSSDEVFSARLSKITSRLSHYHVSDMLCYLFADIAKYNINVQDRWFLASFFAEEAEDKVMIIGSGYDKPFRKKGLLLREEQIQVI